MAARFISRAQRCAVLLAALAILPVAATAQTNPLKLFKGTITSSANGKPVDGGRLVVYQGSNPEPVTTSKINPGTGFYQVILSPATEYRFEVVSPRFYLTQFPVTTPPGTNYEETVKDLKVELIPIGNTLFSGRLFDPGSSKLEETDDFRKVIETMKKERAMAVTITLVPDIAPAAKKAAPPKKKPKKGKKGEEPVAETPVVTVSDNSAQLGEARMAVVKNLFKQHGISTTRLTWDMKPVMTLQPASGKGKGAKYPDNVTVKITSIQADEENDS